MTGLVRKATLFGVCGLFVAGAALANVPSPVNSTVPDWIPVVGTQAGVPHGQIAGSTPMEITIVVRDFTNNPIAGSVVTIDFGGCVANGPDGAGQNDINICDAVAIGQACGAAGAAGNVVTATTDASGTVTLTVLGGAFANTVDGPGTKELTVDVYADAVFLGSASAFTLDLNADNAHSGSDIAYELVDVARYQLSAGTIFRARAAKYARSRAPGTYSLDGLDIAQELALNGESALSKGSFTGCNPYSYCP